MADAGKLLIPEALRKGKDYKDYTEDDLQLLEEHYQNVCEQQRNFVIWEGPLEDPRYALASSRKAPSLSSESQDVSEGGDSSDFRFESHSAKFRIVLPSGQKPPAGYVQVGSTRQLPVQLPPQQPASQSTDCLVRLPSGLLVQQLPADLLQDLAGQDWSYSTSEAVSSPTDSGILSPCEFLGSPREGSPAWCGDTPSSGLGSGADSLGWRQDRRSVPCQTDPLPPEFHLLQAGEQRAAEAERAREEEARILQESSALARRQAGSSGESEMGDTVMRYLKMVRRNSKCVDQKKADRFRSMNYDPTLRNIKSKYVHSQTVLEPVQHVATQAGQSLLNILKLCETPIEPPRERPVRRKV